MIATILTKRQESRLLKMTRTLFPEIQNFDEDDLYFGVNCLVGDWKLPNGKYKYFEIHWFEFVMCYLVSRLQHTIEEKLGEDAVWEEQPGYAWNPGKKWTIWSKFMFAYPKSMNGGSVFPSNPIDFLYNYFKKLK